MDLYNNRIAGSIPSQLGLLSQLGHLKLSKNKFTGFIPSQLGQLTKLSKLRLDDNDLSNKTIPAEVEALRPIPLFYLRV